METNITYCLPKKVVLIPKINVYMPEDQLKKVDELISISLLGGRGYPSDPDIKGMWLGHSWSHKRGHFWRLLLESFAYEYACVIEVMKSNYPEIKFDEIIVK